MKLKIGVLFAIAALSVVAAGSARADVPQLPSGASWCGEFSDAACDTSMIYVECADGTVWLVDPAYTDGDTFGEAMCGGDYAVLQPPAPATTDPSSGDQNGTNAPPVDLGGGTDVGLGGDVSMAPDPSQYATDVQCPDGSIWAVAIGDESFVCPAA